MQIEAKDLILFLMGVLQAWFFYDKTRNDAKIKELSDGLKSMIEVMHKLEKDLSLARYVLFEDKRKGKTND